MKHNLEYIGQTVDDFHVGNNVFKIYETYGIPLGVIVGYLHSIKVKVNWLDFWDDAIKSGMNYKNVLSMIRNAVNDTFDDKYTNELIRRLQLIIMNRYENTRS